MGTDRERATWEDQQGALRDIESSCRQSGIDFHLIVFPLLFNLDNYPYDVVEDEILRFASEAGIPAFSLLKGFRGLEAHSLWVAAHDQHPNEKGHRAT